MLPGKLDAAHGRLGAVDLLGHAEHRRLAGGRIDHAVDRLPLGAADDEVGDVLQEEVDRGIGIRLVIPFGRDIEIVREIRLERRAAAARGQRADALARDHRRYRRHQVEHRPGERAGGMSAEEHTYELQALMRMYDAVYGVKKKEM